MVKDGYQIVANYSRGGIPAYQSESCIHSFGFTLFSLQHPISEKKIAAACAASCDPEKSARLKTGRNLLPAYKEWKGPGDMLSGITFGYYFPEDFVGAGDYYTAACKE